MTEDSRKWSVLGLWSNEGVLVYVEAGNDFRIGFFDRFPVRNNTTPVYVAKRKGVGLSAEMYKMGTPGNVVIYKQIPDVF